MMMPNISLMSKSSLLRDLCHQAAEAQYRTAPYLHQHRRFTTFVCKLHAPWEVSFHFLGVYFPFEGLNREKLADLEPCCWP